ncbi:MAG: hypothetical protein JWO22_3411 [Frankiales bacterium]|nr:hypothetical protein [Frankiales bacterium]
MSKKRAGRRHRRQTTGTRLLWGEHRAELQHALAALDDERSMTSHQLLALLRAVLRAEVALAQLDLLSSDPRRLLVRPEERRRVALDTVVMSLDHDSAS